MSNLVFPALPGLKWDRQKNPMFSTHIQRATSLREIRLGLSAYPLWDFEMSYDVLREKDGYLELNQVRTLFLEVQGAYDSFLYSDPDDNAVTAQSIGTGDGNTTQFQLVRTLTGNGGFTFTEPVQNVSGTAIIYANGVAVANSVSSTGLVTCNAAPSTGNVITWTGSYYYRVRFKEDSYQFNQFMYKLWELKKLSFVGAPGNKV